MDPRLSEDYKACLKLARSHYENFPVASWFLPSKLRPHIAAVYAFARVADDFADEEEDYKVRLRNLRAWRRGLRAALRALPSPLRLVLRPPSGQASPLPMGEGILRAVAASVREGLVPSTELYRLLDAFEHDAKENGYGSMQELLSYCRNSACSIGRILLHLFRMRDAKVVRASDSLCTALQLTNFWQDFSRDLPRGRVTLPRKEAKKFAVPTRASAITADSNFEKLLGRLCGRTRLLYAQAESFPSLAPPSLARQIRVTLAGGRLILDKVETLGPRILQVRPRLTWHDAPSLLLRAFL